MSVSYLQGIHRCDSSKCRMCNLQYLDTSTTFYSICSNNKYELSFPATCQTKSCIYLLSCKKCEMCYVGQTINTVRDRLNGHRNHITAGTEAVLMMHHFTKVHNVGDMQIKPIELCTKEDLGKREKYWIAELNTLFPYGLNNRADFGGFHDVYEEISQKRCGKTVYSVFNKVQTKRRTRGKRNPNNDTNATFSPEEFLDDVVELSADQSHIVHLLRTYIMQLNNDNTKELLLHTILQLNDNSTISASKIEYFLFVVRDLCLFKYQRNYTKKKSSQFIVVEFVNKYLNDVNLTKIINASAIKSLFPINNDKYVAPSTSFKYTKTVRSKILNYKRTIFEEDTSTHQCKCSDYNDKFIDRHHKHVFTGDIDIVENGELRKIFSYGPNFREQQPPDKVKALRAITSGIDAYIDSVSNATNTSKASFSNWKKHILDECENKLAKLKPYPYNIILSKIHVRNSLDKLHQDLVVVPIDKAGCNVAFICKSFYMQTLSYEVTQSSTFNLSANSTEEIFDSCNQFLQRHKLGIGNDRLPFLYWTAKMHKDPYSYRYITSGKDTVTSPLSNDVSACLRLLLKFARNSKKYRFKGQSGINNISIIDNRDKAINFMNLCNKTKSKKTLKTYDFSTLYTSIPHDKLKKKNSEFVKKIYGLANKKYIIVNSKWSYFSDKPSTKFSSCTAANLVEWISFIIDNSYVTFQNNVYRQVIGIPMGTSCAPFLANLFLHVYEYSYIENLIGQGEIQLASQLSRMFRYQDDCIIFNDNGAFNDHCILIYPSEMVLKCTNISPAKSTFLDLTISVYRNKYKYVSYDKRNDFGFDIVNYPNLCGNIPKMQAYGVFVSQLVRLSVVNDNYTNFVMDTKHMVGKLLTQGFERHTLRVKHEQFIHKYIANWCKYGVVLDSPGCINLIF